MKKEDLTNQRFGMLTIIEQAETRIHPKGSRATMWKCKCDCGNIVLRSSNNLKAAKHPSCGCWRKTHTSKLLDDLTNKRFGRLTVLSKAPNHVTPGGAILTVWNCKCDCGKELQVYARNLKTGHTTSCGCYREEVRPTQRYEHGYGKTRIYGVYGKMKERCYNPKNPSYHRYGGRGITMCDEWLNDPKAFCEWAYANGYKEDAPYGECTVDRIDNNKGYSPDNCRIVNEKVQANNRSTNFLIEHNGETKTLAQWRDYFGMTQYQAYHNLVEKHRSIQDIIDNGID